jgi:hypothetical protein
MDSFKERERMKEETTTPKKLLSHKGAIEKNHTSVQTVSPRKIIGVFGRDSPTPKA